MHFIIFGTSLEETFEGIFTRRDFKQILLIFFNGFNQLFFNFEVIIKGCKNFLKSLYFLEFSTHQIGQKGEIIDRKVVFK